MLQHSFIRVTAGLCSGVLALPLAQAQIAQEQVLVVYDSRVPDSRAVAEIYAGSKKVPGGSGTEAGFRPAVRVLDLASAGAAMAAPADISYTDFVAKIRTPIRNHLSSQNLTQRVRCIVMTKGLPHRMMDSDVPNAGDFPSVFIGELQDNDCTSAGVDAQLAILWQELNSGELGGAGDSKDDGLIVNPYARSASPIQSQNNANITAAKTLNPSGLGPLWTIGGSAGTPQRFTPGDVYLTSRLDGRSVGDVRSMLQRAQNILINTNTAAVILDESGENLDNVGSTWSSLNAGNDYELTQTTLVNDRRFSFSFPSPPPNVRYDALAGPANFFVGPNLAFAAGQGVLVTNPVILLATYGSNHGGGVPTLAAGGSSGTVYAASFNYAPGAIFNTIESYNGRDFGGLGPWFIAQQQAADYLASGGTFAVCNVWEPLADTIPDNRYLTQNFILGNLSWAEAAWTSIPALSWMQMALGDPVARASRTNEDLDANARISIDDLFAWEALPASSPAKDINRSGAADSADRLLVLSSSRASERVQLTLTR
jgi:hypothetical protein